MKEEPRARSTILLRDVAIVVLAVMAVLAGYTGYNLGYDQGQVDLGRHNDAMKVQGAESQKPAQQPNAPKENEPSGPPALQVSSHGVDQLSGIGLEELTSDQQARALEALNSVPAPCEPCTNSGMSVASCLLENPICANMGQLGRRAVRMAREGRDAAAITDAITYSEPWAPVEVGQAPSKGSADAPVTVVVFSEFECGFCARAVGTMEELLSTYGDQVRVVFKHLPLPRHAQAEAAARGAVAAARQGRFWEFHDFIFANQRRLREPGILEEAAVAAGLDLERWRKDLDSPDVAALVRADMAQGRSLGVRGTPTFFVNGYRVRGARPLPVFARIIDAELDDLKHGAN